MLQVVLQAPQRLVFREKEKPKPAAKQVLLQIKRIGICGSDIHAYYGKHPYISCPIVQGHEFSGIVTELGAGADRLSIGDRVTVMPQLVCGSCFPCTHGNYNICNQLKVIGCQAEGAAQEYLAVDLNLVVKLPDGMSLDYGAMVEPVAVGVHAVRRLAEVKGQNILVMGAGTIGNLTAQAAKAMGANSVMITDLSDFRLKTARECGIDHTVNMTNEILEERIDFVFGPDRADAVLECVGVQETLDEAVPLARKGTDIIIVGVFAEKPVVDIGLVQDKELRLIGTLMYREEDYRTAIDLMVAGRINPDPLISRHFPFSEYAEAYKYIEKYQDKVLKILIDVNEAS